jgi:hypothetical protein
LKIIIFYSLLRRHLTEESGGEKKYFFSKPTRRLKPIERPAEEAKYSIEYCIFSTFDLVC